LSKKGIFYAFSKTFGQYYANCNQNDHWDSLAGGCPEVRVTFRPQILMDIPDFVAAAHSASSKRCHKHGMQEPIKTHPYWDVGHRAGVNFSNKWLTGNKILSLRLYNRIAVVIWFIRSYVFGTDINHILVYNQLQYWSNVPKINVKIKKNLYFFYWNDTALKDTVTLIIYNIFQIICYDEGLGIGRKRWK